MGWDDASDQGGRVAEKIQSWCVCGGGGGGLEGIFFHSSGHLVGSSHQYS